MNPNTLDFANLVVNRYLYNSDTPPADRTDSSLIRPVEAKGEPIEVDTRAYMATVGRFALPNGITVTGYYGDSAFNPCTPRETC